MARRLDYMIGLNIDASKLNGQLTQAFQALRNISKGETGNLGLTAELKEGIIAANQIESIMKRSMNMETGKLDLAAFRRNLTTAGTNLATLQQQMAGIGPVGEQAFRNVAQAIASAEVPVMHNIKLLDNLWVTMKNTVRWQVTTTALRTFIGSVESAMGYVKDLDESLNNIRIVTGQSAEQMGLFAERANQAASRLSTTTTEYTDASLIYYQQGLPDKEVQARTDITVKMANVSGQAAEDASEQLTAVWNNFSEGADDLEHFADVMVKLGAETASSSDEIATGLQKFAAVASTVGMSYDASAAALATLTAETRESASVVGTSLRTLFSRLQGLKLGDTLEDGTDLNKYSQALATVGVNIKNADGELKEMEQILFELGDVWPTLARDQQVALATTVAGVRQYTQLIGLMNNWGKFQDNLERARTADGSLETQANIYAESWEAARDRVKNSVQDIYDSLLDSQFFINFDNGLSGILHGIASVIDGMGGMYGAAANLGNLFFSLFGNQIANSVRDVGYAFGFITKQENQALEELKSQAAELAKQMSVVPQQMTKQYAAPLQGAEQYFSNVTLAGMNQKTYQLRGTDYTIVDLRKQELDLTNQLTKKEAELAALRANPPQENKNIADLQQRAKEYSKALSAWKGAQSNRENTIRELQEGRDDKYSKSGKLIAKAQPGLSEVQAAIKQYEGDLANVQASYAAAAAHQTDLKNITAFSQIQERNTQNYIKQAELQDNINKRLGSMNSLERERVSALTQQLDLMQQSVSTVIAQGEAAEKNYQMAKQSYDNKMGMAITDPNAPIELQTDQLAYSRKYVQKMNRLAAESTDPLPQTVQLKEAQKIIAALGMDLNKLPLDHVIQTFNKLFSEDNLPKTFATLTDQFSALTERSANIQILQNALKNVGGDASKLADELKVVNDQVNLIGKNGQQLQLKDLTQDTLSAAFSETESRINTIQSFLQNQLHVNGDELQHLRMAQLEHAAATLQSIQAQTAWKEALDRANESIVTGAYRITDLAQRVVEYGQAFMRISGYMTAMNGIVTALTDTTMQATQRLLSLVSGIGMFSMNFMQFSSLISNAFKEMVRVEGTTVVATSNLSAARWIAAAAAGAHASETEAEAAMLAAVSSRAALASFAILGISVAVLAAVKAYDYFSKSQERAKQAIDDSTEAYKSQQDTVDQLQNELSEKQARLQELQDLPSRSVQEGEELKLLQQQIPYLERKLELEKQSLEVAQAQAFQNLQENYQEAYKEGITPGANSAESRYSKYISSQDAIAKFQPHDMESLAEAAYYQQQMSTGGDQLSYLAGQIEEVTEARDALLADKSGDIHANQQQAERLDQTLADLTAQYKEAEAAKEAWINGFLSSNSDIEGEVEGQMDQWRQEQLGNYQAFRANLEMVVGGIGSDFQAWAAQPGMLAAVEGEIADFAEFTKNMYGEADYADTFLQPLMESTGVLNDIKQQVSEFSGTEITIDADPYREELVRSLVSTDDFVNYVQERTSNVQNALNDVFQGNVRQRDSFIEGLSNAEYTALFKVDLEGVEDFNDLYGKIYELTSNQQVVDFDVGTETLSGAVEEILSLKKDEYALSPETISKLQEQFAGIFDFRALPYESLVEQAQILSEAFAYLSDPDSMIESVKSGLSDMRDELEEVNSEITDTQRELKELGPGAEKAASDLNKQLDKLKKRKVQIEVDTKTAQKQLQKINEFKIKDKTFELKMEGAKAILAEASAIEKAAKLVEKGWKVSGQNIAEFVQTWPEALKGAQVDMTTGMVQLNEQWLAHLKDTINQSVAATVLGANEELNVRLAQYSTEMDYLSQVAQAAENGSQQALTAVTGDSKEEVRVRNMAMRDIVLAKIEQCVQEKTQSGLAAQNAIDAQNQVTDASNKEGNAVADNWGNVAVAVEDSLWKAFSAGSQYQEAVANGGDLARIMVTATQAVGMKSSGSSYKAPALGGDKGAAGSGGTGNSWEEPDYYDLVKEQLGEDAAALYQFALSDMTSPFRDDENGLDWKHYSELNPEGAQAYLDRMAAAGQQLGININSDAFTGKTSEERWDSFVKDYEANTSPYEIRKDAQSAYDRRMHINALDILRAAQGASPGGAANDLYNKGLDNSKNKSPSEKQPKEQKHEDLEDPKKLDDILERYHEITRAIEDQEEVLDDIDNYMDLVYGQKRLDQYNVKLGQLGKQMDNYKQKMAEAKSYIPGDQEAIRNFFPDLNVEFDEFTGEIKDYHGVVEDMLRQYNAVIDEYNAYIETYNAMTGDQQDEESVKNELDAMKKRKEDADELLDKQQEALDRYEETLDTIKEVDNEMQELGRNMEALRLDQIVYKVEVVAEVKDTKDAIRDFQRSLTESFSDSLYNSMNGPQMLGMRGAVEQSWAQAMADRAYLSTLGEELNALEHRMAEATDAASIQDIKDQMIDLQGAAIETGESLVEWLSSLSEIFPSALEDVSARFEVFTNQLEHNKTIFETMQEIYALQGQTYKTLEGFNRLQKAEAGRKEAASSLAKANREWSENIRAELQASLDAFDKAKEEWMSNPARDPAAWETSTAYNVLKPQIDALLAEYDEAQEAMYSSAQEAIEIAQEMYLEQIERAVYEFGQTLSNDLGLDLLQTKYDHYIEEEERYVDKVNEAYQVSQWYLRLQKDIEKNQNEVMDKRLKDLMDEVHLRRENNTLSQYDLDILEAKYEVLKAQMALEDAQENRNQLRLVRDRQGNWNYQFTADPDELADREKEVLDKQSEWYNLAKGQVKDVTGQIIDTWTQCQEDIKEIYSDMTLTDQERADRAAEIYDYYTQKVKYLESEKQLAIQDMTEAGNNLLFDSAVVSGDQITDLTQITADDIKQITEDSGASIIELLVMNNDQIKDIVGSNTQLIDNFTNTYGTDLDRMTANTNIFESNLRDTLDKCQTHFEEYYNVIDRVNQDAGTALDNMDLKTDALARTTDNLRSSTSEATDQLRDMLDAVWDATQGYIDLAESIRAAVDAANQLAAKSGADVSSMTGMTDDEIDDYDALIEYGLVSGAIKYGDRTYKELFGQREDRIDTRGWRNLVDYAGEAASQHYAGIQEGDNLSRWTMDRYGGENSFQRWLEDMKKLGYNFPGLASSGNIASMATGGYTGEFEDGKLAFLHEKELVLNEHDTENILSAINMLRILTPDMLSSISDQLRMTARVTSNLMDKMLTPITVSAPAGTLDQNVHIEATFPNVTDSSEILDAFNTLTNDAAQWAQLRRG